MAKVWYHAFLSVVRGCVLRNGVCVCVWLGGRKEGVDNLWFLCYLIYMRLPRRRCSLHAWCCGWELSVAMNRYYEMGRFDIHCQWFPTAALSTNDWVLTTNVSIMGGNQILWVQLAWVCKNCDIVHTRRVRVTQTHCTIWQGLANFDSFGILVSCAHNIW